MSGTAVCKRKVQSNNSEGFRFLTYRVSNFKVAFTFATRHPHSLPGIHTSYPAFTLATYVATRHSYFKAALTSATRHSYSQGGIHITFATRRSLHSHQLPGIHICCPALVPAADRNLTLTLTDPPGKLRWSTYIERFLPN